MNREIKFRVWDKDHKCFLPNDIYDIHSRTSFNSFGIIRKDWKNYSIGEYFYDDTQVLQQFTGLKDVNGKEIYEGDILSNGFKVYFSKDHACFWAGDMPLCHMNSHRYVIGNIYKNPELIK